MYRKRRVYRVGIPCICNQYDRDPALASLQTADHLQLCMDRLALGVETSLKMPLEEDCPDRVCRGLGK